jgi:hypothetical protein
MSYKTYLVGKLTSGLVLLTKGTSSFQCRHAMIYSVFSYGTVADWLCDANEVVGSSDRRRNHIMQRAYDGFTVPAPLSSPHSSHLLVVDDKCNSN